MDVRGLQGIDCRAPGSDEMHEVWRRQAGAGFRRARYLVFLGLIAVYNPGLARENARSGSFLSYDAADHGLRESVLLGGPPDYVLLVGSNDYFRLPLHART